MPSEKIDLLQSFHLKHADLRTNSQIRPIKS